METTKIQDSKAARTDHHYRLRPLQGKRTISVIYSPDEFHRVLMQECQRSDRYSLRFSLAVFEVGTQDESSVLIRRLVRTIHHRFRNTDEIGWYRKGQIGVILPFTPSEGAWKLAEYVSGIVSSVTSPPAFAIYSYPSKNWPIHRFSKRIFSFLDVRGYFQRLLTIPLPPSGEFHAMIARERGRSDRNGNLFSLIIFKMKNMPPGISVQRRMLMDLSSRLRDTDEIGWYDELHLSAILPYAKRSDARQIAEKICRNIGVVPDENAFTIYTYPENWFSGLRPPVVDLAPEPPAKRTPLAGSSIDLPTDTSDIQEENPPEKSHSAFGSDTFLYRPQPVWKRVLDIVGSFIAIFLLSPLFLFATAVIKLASPGPVLFRQKRVGYMGKLFTLYKFRTMEVNAETASHSQYVRKLIVEDKEAAPMTKMELHPSIIRGGRLLRASCIDELPQLFNVLLGDMSLVGPRPCLPYEAEEYMHWHARRFDSLPGMTGLWQVKGKNQTTFKKMIRLDISYAQNRSFWLDLQILLNTFPAILRQLLKKS